MFFRQQLLKFSIVKMEHDTCYKERNDCSESSAVRCVMRYEFLERNLENVFRFEVWRNDIELFGTKC